MGEISCAEPPAGTGVLRLLIPFVVLIILLLARKPKELREVGPTAARSSITGRSSYVLVPLALQNFISHVGAGVCAAASGRFV